MRVRTPARWGPGAEGRQSHSIAPWRGAPEGGGPHAAAPHQRLAPQAQPAQDYSTGQWPLSSRPCRLTNVLPHSVRFKQHNGGGPCNAGGAPLIHTPGDGGDDASARAPTGA
jgi:hypothetical protein